MSLIAEKLAAFGGLVSGRDVVTMPWLRVPQLYEREGSRVRLQAWARAGRPIGPFAPSVVSTSGALFERVSEVLAVLPPPVAWHAAQRVLFVGLDARTAGAAAYIPPMPPAPDGLDEGVHVVLLRDLPRDQMHSLTAHEIAHAWTATVRSTGAGMTSAELFACCSSFVTNPTLTPAEQDALRAAARGEELAHVLAFEWGFRGRHSDPAALRQRNAAAYVMEGITR